MIKILYVIKPFLPYEELKSIGASVYALNLAQKLKSKYKDDLELHIMSNYEIPGFTTIPTDNSSKYENICVAKKLNEIGNNYDIVHIHLFTYTPLDIYYKYLDFENLKYNLVITQHMSALGRSIYLNGGYLRFLSQKLGNRLFWTTPSYKNGILPLFKSKCFNLEGIQNLLDGINYEVVPSFIDTEMPINYNNEKVYDVGCISRITSSKNCLETLKYCVSRKLKVLFIGKASYNVKASSVELKYCKDTEEFIENNPEYITNIKQVERSKIYDYITQCKVMFHLSKGENNSLVVLESMYAGVPVLLCNLPVDDTDAFKKGSLNITKDEISRKLEKSRFKIYDEYRSKLLGSNYRVDKKDFEYYTLDSVADSFKSIYEKFNTR